MRRSRGAKVVALVLMGVFVYQAVYMYVTLHAVPLQRQANSLKSRSLARHDPSSTTLLLAVHPPPPPRKAPNRKGLKKKLPRARRFCVPCDRGLVLRQPVHINRGRSPPRSPSVLEALRRSPSVRPRWMGRAWHAAAVTRRAGGAGNETPPACCTPAALVVGPGRTGTTALAAYLAWHPNATVGLDKEHNFWWAKAGADRFSLPWEPKQPPRSRGAVGRAQALRWYAHRFPAPGRHVRAVDVSPSMFRLPLLQPAAKPGAARDLRAWLPGIRAVIMLRDPVARLLSHFRDQITHRKAPAARANDAFAKWVAYHLLRRHGQGARWSGATGFGNAARAAWRADFAAANASLAAAADATPARYGARQGYFADFLFDQGVRQGCVARPAQAWVDLLGRRRVLFLWSRRLTRAAPARARAAELRRLQAFVGLRPVPLPAAALNGTWVSGSVPRELLLTGALRPRALAGHNARHAREGTHRPSRPSARVHAALRPLFLECNARQRFAEHCFGSNALHCGPDPYSC